MYIEQQLVGLAWVFGWAAFFLVLKAMANRSRQRKLDLIHRERIAALEKGVPMPELPEYDSPSRVLTAARLNPRWPLGVGILLIMAGAGVSVALQLSGDPYHNQVWPFGLIGVFVGVGLFAFYAVMKGRPADR